MRSAIAWYRGKFNLTIGIVTIGIATVILMLFGKRKDRSNADFFTGLAPIVLGAISLLIFRRPSTADLD